MIVGLGHAARVGKDSTADILCADYGFERLSFAAKLKEVALSTNPIVNGTHHLKACVEEAGWDATKSLFPESRVFLQRLGVACRSLIDEYVWINPVLERIFAEPDRNWVVTDVRFRNECQALTLAEPGVKTVLVNVTRPGYGTSDGHVSETELANFPWDYTLRNDGTLDDLGHRVQVMVGGWS